MNCYKCKNKISWYNCDCVIADGKYNTIKGKVYCNRCYFGGKRLQDIKNNSIRLNIDIGENK